MRKLKILEDNSNYTNKDYEHLGRLMHSIGETGYPNKFQLYKVSFIKGIWAGLGGVIGATIVVSLLLWLFTILGSIPFIGPIVDTVQNNISND